MFRQKRLLIAAGCAASIVAAVGAVAVTTPVGHTRHATSAHRPTWSAYTDGAREVRIEHPRDWTVARKNLTPHLRGSGPAWEIVSLGTYRLRHR